MMIANIDKDDSNKEDNINIDKDNDNNDKDNDSSSKDNDSSNKGDQGEDSNIKDDDSNNYSEKMFTDILKGIGATNSKYNLLWMKVWRISEGAKATYNPWNSTQKITSGIPSTRYNSVGVQNYFTFQNGVDATITTMKNGHYPYIIKALQKGIKDYAEMKELATLVQMWDMTGKIPTKWQ
jgi:hypothetical protein